MKEIIDLFIEKTKPQWAHRESFSIEDRRHRIMRFGMSDNWSGWTSLYDGEISSSDNLLDFLEFLKQSRKEAKESISRDLNENI